MSGQKSDLPAKHLTAINVVVGRVVKIRPHPNGDFISLADVVYGPDKASQIIFGGKREVVKVGCLVPTAPPTKSCRVEGKKMRRRKYRGVYSYGELCSLFELGLADEDTDQVAILQDLPIDPGTPITSLLESMTTYDELWSVFKRPI